MEANSVFCIYCGKKIFFEPEQPPAFCLYCGKKVVLPGADAVQRQAPSVGTPSANPAMKFNHHERRQHELPPEVLQKLREGDKQSYVPPKQDAPKQPQIEFMEFADADYEAPESNSEFCDEKGLPMMSGWLPEGFVPEGDIELNADDMDRPFAIWAKAKHPSGTEWFCRKYKTYHIDKMSKQPQQKFLRYDDYLDREAVSLLGNASVRLVLRVPATEEELKKEYDALVKFKESILSAENESVKVVIQSGYGERGGKLYEAEIDGKKKYLFLHAYMLVMEYGFCNEVINRSQSTINSMVQMIQSNVGSSFGGFGGASQFSRQSMPQIDTDRNKPCGTHRTDGLVSNTISWTIVDFGGIVSETMPTREEIRDFIRFIYSLKIIPKFQQEIEKVQQQMVQQHIMTNQMIANSMMQANAARQREFDRHNAVMRGIRADMDAIQQQHIAYQNAAFDRSVRRDHEMVMGVNTYERTDGTRIEADVSIDRVFQHQNDPTLLVGTSSTVDPPPDWIELEKLK